MENNKSKQKQHLIDMMKLDEEAGLYEEPKQETTLEEVANEYSKKKYSIDYGYCEEDYYISFLSFRDGAKWQAEQIGKSEFLQKLRGTLSDAEARRLIFETFNK